MWKFPGQKSNLCHRNDLSHSSDSCRSLTVRPPGNAENIFVSNKRCGKEVRKEKEWTLLTKVTMFTVSHMKLLVKEVLHFEATLIHKLKTICCLKNIWIIAMFTQSANFYNVSAHQCSWRFQIRLRLSSYKSVRSSYSDRHNLSWENTINQRFNRAGLPWKATFLKCDINIKKKKNFLKYKRWKQV